MALGNFRFMFFIKCFLAIAWACYFLLFNSSYRDYWHLHQASDIEFKKEIRRSAKIALCGGSNVAVGLSAEEISSKFQCINLGLNGEYGSFEGYLNWLNKGVSSEIIIYSPALLWSESYRNHDRENFYFISPPSIISQLYTKYKLKLNKIRFCSFYGDELQYPVDQIDYFQVDSIKFSKSNFDIIFELNRRINELKNIKNVKLVYLRVPPVYTSSKLASRMNFLITQRVNLLKSYNVKILSTTMVSLDSTNFRNSFHPNRKGRHYFSSELINSLIGNKVY